MGGKKPIGNNPSRGNCHSINSSNRGSGRSTKFCTAPFVQQEQGQNLDENNLPEFSLFSSLSVESPWLLKEPENSDIGRLDAIDLSSSLPIILENSLEIPNIYEDSISQNIQIAIAMIQTGAINYALTDLTNLYYSQHMHFAEISDLSRRIDVICEQSIRQNQTQGQGFSSGSSSTAQPKDLAKMEERIRTLEGRQGACQSKMRWNCYI